VKQRSAIARKAAVARWKKKPGLYMVYLGLDDAGWLESLPRGRIINPQYSKYKRSCQGRPIKELPILFRGGFSG
jgi:hypothetical protein